MIVIEGLEILRLRGSGGFADVYEAMEPALDRRVAVKVFRARIDREDRATLEREARATGRLSGTRNIVHVYRAGVTDDEQPYLVMELMEGSVADRLRDGPIPLNDSLRLGILLGDALSAAHEAGVLHRDIKPENVLLDRYGEPALSDFGIAALIESGVSSSIYAFTAAHAAPEVFEQSRSSPASDVYSFASTLYTFLEGHSPFSQDEGEGPLSFMRRVQETEPAAAVLTEEASPELNRLLQEGRSKRPDDRPTMVAFVAALRQIEAAQAARSGLPDLDARPTRWVDAETKPPPPESARSEPHGSPSRRSRIRSGVLIGVLTIALVVAAVVAAHHWSGTSRHRNTTAAATRSTTTQKSLTEAGPPPDARPTTLKEAAAFNATVNRLYPTLNAAQVSCVSGGVFPQLSSESRSFIVGSSNILALPPSERIRVLAVITTCVPPDTAAPAAVGFLPAEYLVQPTPTECLANGLTTRVQTSGAILEGSIARTPDYLRAVADSIFDCTDESGRQTVIRQWLDARAPNSANCLDSALIASSTKSVLEDLFQTDSRSTYRIHTPALSAAAATCHTTVTRGTDGYVVNDNNSTSASDFVATHPEASPVSVGGG